LQKIAHICNYIKSSSEMKKPTEYQKHRGGKKDVGRPTKKKFRQSYLQIFSCY